MNVTVIIHRLRYQVKHLHDGQMLVDKKKGEGDIINQYTEKAEVPEGHFIEDVRRELVDSTAVSINRQNRQSEMACKDKKSPTIELLIITNVN